MAILTQSFALDLSALSGRTSVAPVVRAAVKIAVVVMHWDEACRTRKTLQTLTADQLSDVGLTREQVQTEVKRAFWNF